MSMELHELTSLMQQLLIWNWDDYTIRLDWDASKICAINLFLEATRINDGKQQILLTNNLSELMVSQEDVCVFPRELLYISWGRLGTKYIVLGRHLVSTSLDSLDGFLSDIAMLTLKSRQKEFNILRTQLNTWKHLCLTMVTKPRVKGANYTRGVTTQRGW
jgi:hypothetical protein